MLLCVSCGEPSVDEFVRTVKILHSRSFSFRWQVGNLRSLSRRSRQAGTAHRFFLCTSRFAAHFDAIGVTVRYGFCTRRYKSVLSRHSFGTEGIIDEMEEGEGGEDDEDELAKDVFLGAGKSHYRRRDPLPNWVQIKKNEIRQNRTMAQIRRCLKSWMIKAGTQNKRGPAYRDRPLEWKETQKNLGATRVSDGTLDVKAYGPEETVAYMHYFFPGKFSIHRRVFRDLTSFLGPEFRPNRILDFGCGPGTAAAAAIEVWGEDPNMLYTGVDMSRSMLDAAKLMLENCAINKIFYDRIGGISKRALDEGDTYDFIVCSYTLTELSNDHLRRTAVQLLYELLSVNGVIVFIEGGDPMGSHTTRTARKFILDTGASGYQSANSRDKRVSRINASAPGTVPSVVAPCTHNKDCPLSGGTWCSFSQSIEGGFLSKNNVEKFSYVAIQKVETENNHKVTSDIADELQLAYPLRQQDWGRIVRSPMKNRGHVLMDVCYPDGSMGRSIVSKSKEGRMPLIYRAARKSQWGGLFPAYGFPHVLTEDCDSEEKC